MSSIITPTGQNPDKLLHLLDTALDARAGVFDLQHKSAIRLFSGFYEGFPDLVIDLYGRTIVIFNYARDPESLRPTIQAVQRYLLERFAWIKAVILKTRHADSVQLRRGVVIFGDSIDTKILENGAWYALDLRMNQDASLYLDTRNLRLWALNNLAGMSILNTFSYTGSLGVAARVGGASRIVHTDLNPKYIDIVKASYSMNGFDFNPSDFITGDYWVSINQLKRAGELFGCVIVDPPYFALTAKGRVDLISQSQRVINKARPLVSHDGLLVIINNALFVSGIEFMATLESLCASGYLSIESLIAIPEDITGYSNTRLRKPLIDPAPFNHSTKIAVLRVQREDRRRY